MTRARWTPLALPVLLVALAAGAARGDDLDEDFQVWTPVVLQLDLSPKVLRAYIEVQPRLVDDAGRLGAVLWRPALGVYATDWLTLWAGYALVEVHHPRYAAEHRIWEQVQASDVVAPGLGLTLLGRLRLEHRLREGADPVAHRVRLLARASLPLGDPGPPGLYAVVWDEVFIGLNTVAWGPASGFDRNRSFVGLGVKALAQLRIEAGYLLEVVHRRGDLDELGHHALAVTLWIDL